MFSIVQLIEKKRSDTAYLLNDCIYGMGKKLHFREKVFAIVVHIPRGETLNYGEVARLAGFPGAARAVGSLLAKNFNLAIPCHRVIRSDGRLGNYNRGGEAAKRKLLEGEGVRFDKAESCNER